jgi:hypothetical protein
MTVSELTRNAGFPGDRVRQAGLSRVRFERFQRIAAPFSSQLEPYTHKRAVAPSVDGEGQAAQARPCVPHGRPSLTAIVSAMSARLARAPIGPGGTPAPKARIGTCSRV